MACLSGDQGYEAYHLGFISGGFSEGVDNGIAWGTGGVDRREFSLRCQGGSGLLKGATRAQSVPGGFPPGVLSEGVDHGIACSQKGWTGGNSLLPSWLEVAEEGLLVHN